MSDHTDPQIAASGTDAARGVSDSFRSTAERLFTMMTHSMQLRTALDEAIQREADMRGALHAAVKRREIAERALDEDRQLTAPVAEFLLRIMEREAETQSERESVSLRAELST